MAKRKPFGVYDLLDSEPSVALIRYDGDPDTFTALAATWLADRHAEYEDGDYSIEPPRPRLYRFNPTTDPDFSWSLGYPSRPGPGVFVGALLDVGRRWSCAYCLVRYDEGHADDCVKMLRDQARMDSGSYSSGGES
jgi:hypothetical protein